MISRSLSSRDIMPIYYTVDRAGTLRAGTTIEPDRDYAANQFFSAINGPDRRALETYVDEMYPGGLSKHGKLYLLDFPHITNTWAAIPGFSPQQTTPMSPMIDLICELVRRADFPRLPSRYTSLFAWGTVDEAIRFRSAGSASRIFEVESDPAFRADMKQLMIGGSGIVALLQARRYWEGAASATPQWEHLLQGPVEILQEVGRPAVDANSS